MTTEARMQNRRTNDPILFVIQILSFIRHSSFGIQNHNFHFYFLKLELIVNHTE